MCRLRLVSSGGSTNSKSTSFDAELAHHFLSLGMGEFFSGRLNSKLEFFEIKTKFLFEEDCVFLDLPQC